MTAANYQGGCPYSSVSLHGAQNNQFLRSGGPVQRLFEDEYLLRADICHSIPQFPPNYGSLNDLFIARSRYIRFVKAMLEMPEYFIYAIRTTHCSPKRPTSPDCLVKVTEIPSITLHLKVSTVRTR